MPDALKRIGTPAVLKTRRFGYDGKGQALIRDDTDLTAAWEDVGAHPAIVEAFVPFEREVSVVAARGRDGQFESFDVIENEHRDHILKVSRVPAEVSASVAAEARRIAKTIAAAFGYVGVLAVEMFVVREGAGHAVLVNEIAPRVHNSGHWTLDGCSVSQFEQHIRAIAGWPLAQPVRHGRIEMINLIGDETADYAKWFEVPGSGGTALRQERRPPWPQDGARDAGLRRILTESPCRCACLPNTRNHKWTFAPDFCYTPALGSGASAARGWYWPIPNQIPIEEEQRVQVLVRDNNVDQALKALKKKMQREGIFREMKLRGHYEKPSEKKARERAEAIRRARKLARKRAQREGLIPGKPKPVLRTGGGFGGGGGGGGFGGGGR